MIKVRVIIEIWVHIFAQHTVVYYAALRKLLTLSQVAN